MLIRRRLWLLRAHPVPGRARRARHSPRGSGKGWTQTTIKTCEKNKGLDGKSIPIYGCVFIAIGIFTALEIVFYEHGPYFSEKWLTKAALWKNKMGSKYFITRVSSGMKVCVQPVEKLQINRRASRYRPIRVNIEASSHVRQEHAGYIHHRVGRRKWTQIWAVGKCLSDHYDD